MSAESSRHIRSGGPLTVPSQPPADRSLIDAVSGFINDVKLTSATVDPKDVIQWARFETADINEPTPEGDSDNDISPLLLILGYGTGVQVWLIPPNGEAQEVLSWRQGTVRVLRILPTPNKADCFAAKRPLIALCDSASPGPAFCSLSFISIRGGEQVKSIKFKNPILDVLANKRSVVVSFSERFAVFDAGTLEDRMAVTTCYPCPCPLAGTAPINPLALGDRWLAYADKKLNPSKRSSGGCEGEGQTSYTATVLHAAKSLSKGLRGLGESVAHSLAGTRAASQSPSPPHAHPDHLQPGVLTVLDIEGIEEEDGQDAEDPCDPIVAHFVAHSEAVIALKFDSSGMVLVTADRRGHDFHVFRINPHPCGPALASVHHLYVLHRGDTTAKVQDIAISGDCRWAAISTLRGTTHVFAISPYGGAVGVRTHTAPRVVNRLSRFHRSAGLPIHAPPGKRAPPQPPGSPVGECGGAGAWFPNPRLPPYPLPALSSPLAQLRPTANLATHTITRTSSGRQRLSSLSEESSSAPLLARAAWGPARGGGGSGGGSSHHALYLMAASGALLHLVLHPRPATGVPKEKISDDSPIELEVEPIAQWPLQRPPAAADLLAPLPPSNPLLQPLECRRCSDMCMSEEERWLAQVEIVTHAGPHRRLWMGPQFVFKTYNCTGSNSSLSEAETVEVEGSITRGVARSNPVNMPGGGAGSGGGMRPIVPVLIDSGSASSLEHSPSDSFRRKSLLAESGRAASVCDVQLREDLAEAMKEDQGSSRAAAGGQGASGRGVELAVDPSGTVVRAVTCDPPAVADPDDYTRANSDEATFRPVVRAPAAFPPQHLPARPLPRTTTIPVQSLTHSPRLHPSDVVIPARALSAFLAADARLEREMEEARREPPSVETLPPRTEPPPVSRVKRSPTPRLHSDISDHSPSVKLCSAEPEVDRSRAIDEAVDETSNRIESNDVVRVKMQLAVDAEIKPKSPKRSDAAVSKNIQEIVSLESEIIQKQKRVDANLSSEVKSSPPDTLILESEDVNSVRDGKLSEKGTSQCRETVFADTGKEVFSDTNKQVSDLERLVTKESTELKKESPVPKTAMEEVITEPKTSKKGITPDTKPLKKKESSYTTVTKTLTNKDLSKTIISNKEEILEIKTNKKEEKPENKISKKDMIRESKMLKKKDLTDVTFSKTLKKEMVEPISLRKEENCESKAPVYKDIPNTRLSMQNDITEIDLPVNESVTETEVFTKEESPKLKISSKRNSTERESSSRKDTKELKSAWKKDSTKLEWSMKSELSETMSLKTDPDVSKSVREDAIEIKTEEQAWDMLLNVPGKQVLRVSAQSAVSEKSDENKMKCKKNRKIKKSQDDAQNKSEDDSFVEIHAIEENAQPSSGELVSISMPFEEIESSSSYSSKTKKSRSPKGTIDKKEHSQPKLDDWSLEDIDCSNKNKGSQKNFGKSEIDLVPDYDFKNKNKESKAERDDHLKVESTTSAVIETTFINEASKDKKIKSISNQESRKSVDIPIDVDVKDVYVIDSTKDEFPEIQITSGRGSKVRKKSPQVEKDKKSEEIEVIPEKTVKSWSSIAASKSSKKSEEDIVFIGKKPDLKNAENIENGDIDYDFRDRFERNQRRFLDDEEPTSPISLHEELMRLCKRTDIMVAQCDAPSGLNFIEEHHSLLHGLPPLDLDFGLDDFRLEVMKDSLLDVNNSQISSPICKINIDNIFSSIKESTSAFNLIDLEKVPDKKEKGFSVVENDKITSQEVKADDKSKSEDKELEVMEKSSDDDNASPVLSTDSDKEDKKSSGASNINLPSSKQSTKSKKSRRKKK